MDMHDFILSKISGEFIDIPSILIKHFYNSGRILNASNDELILFLKDKGISEDIIKTFLENKNEYNKNPLLFNKKYNEEIKGIREKEKIEITTISDYDYPQQLKKIPNFPIVLYTKGNFNFDYNKSIAIVGTRTASTYALKKVREIVTELIREGYCVISGLARGIDGEAHRAAINSSGKTAK